MQEEQLQQDIKDLLVILEMVLHPLETTGGGAGGGYQTGVGDRWIRWWR